MTDISYAPAGPNDMRAIAVLQDLMEVSEPIVLVGAWMTRVWLIARKRPEAIRRTNDIDVAITPEVAGTPPLATGLVRLGYAQDTDYRFRYQRMAPAGLLIVDILVDDQRRRAVPDAYPVYGLDTALAVTARFALRVGGESRPVEIVVPTLGRAILLRALALDKGPEGLKFLDYAADLAALAASLDTEAAEEIPRLRVLPEFGRAREIAVPLFSSPDSPGPRAVAQRSRTDPEIAATAASVAVRRFFGA